MSIEVPVIDGKFVTLLDTPCTFTAAAGAAMYQAGQRWLEENPDLRLIFRKASKGGMNEHAAELVKILEDIALTHLPDLSSEDLETLVTDILAKPLSDGKPVRTQEEFEAYVHQATERAKNNINDMVLAHKVIAYYNHLYTSGIQHWAGNIIRHLALYYQTQKTPYELAQSGSKKVHLYPASQYDTEFVAIEKDAKVKGIALRDLSADRRDHDYTKWFSIVPHPARLSVIFPRKEPHQTYGVLPERIETPNGIGLKPLSLGEKIKIDFEIY